MTRDPPVPPAPASGLTIDRCVCRQRLFAELLVLVREGAWDMERLSEETGAGIQCGLCRPYLRRMLSTGQTRFHEVLIGDEA